MCLLIWGSRRKFYQGKGINLFRLFLLPVNFNSFSLCLFVTLKCKFHECKRFCPVLTALYPFLACGWWRVTSITPKFMPLGHKHFLDERSGKVQVQKGYLTLPTASESQHFLWERRLPCPTLKRQVVQCYHSGPVWGGLIKMTLTLHRLSMPFIWLLESPVGFTAPNLSTFVLLFMTNSSFFHT